MIVHNFDPVFIDLGVFQIRWYSIAYIVGIILGWIYAIKIIKEMARKHNFTMIKKTVFDDLIVYLIIGIVLGGRLGYVIFYNFEQNFRILSINPSPPMTIKKFAWFILADLIFFFKANKIFKELFVLSNNI